MYTKNPLRKENPPTPFCVHTHTPIPRPFARNHWAPFLEGVFFWFFTLWNAFPKPSGQSMECVLITLRTFLV